MIISFYLAQVDNSQTIYFVYNFIKEFERNSTLNYGYMEYTLKFFHKMLNKRDILKIINLYVPYSKFQNNDLSLLQLDRKTKFWNLEGNTVHTYTMMVRLLY